MFNYALCLMRVSDVTSCVQHWATERVLWLWSTCDQGYSPVRVHNTAEFAQQYVSCICICESDGVLSCTVLRYVRAVPVCCNHYRFVQRSCCPVPPNTAAVPGASAHIKPVSAGILRFRFPPHSSAYLRLTSGLQSRPMDGVRINLR